MSKISAIMSAYCRNRSEGDCGNMLRRAIESVLGQTFGDFEFIVIDDGSTDGTSEVCREYAGKDSRIRYVRCEENSGCPARRYNDGMKMAKSDLFMYMFDDDFWYPDAMKCLYDAKTQFYKNCGMVYGLTDLVDMQTGQRFSGFGGPWDVNMVKRINILGNLSVIIERRVINSVGGYDEMPLFRRNCDWDLWVRIGQKFPVARLRKSVGCSTARNRDSIGMRVGLSDDDWVKIRLTQALPNRHVRLMGEIGVAG